MALPGSVFTSSISTWPGLDHPSPDNYLFGPNFQKLIYFFDPFRPSFTPLDLKIWPRDYHRKIRHEKLPRMHIQNVPNRPGIPFYDQIFDYFSTHFWLYHPGYPDHCAWRWLSQCKEIFSEIHYWVRLLKTKHMKTHIWSLMVHSPFTAYIFRKLAPGRNN